MLLSPSATSTELVTRPRYEGANIHTWVGFKHFMYLVEEAVLEWLREAGPGARTLFHEYGLGAEIIDCSVQLPAALEIDDQVTVTLNPAPVRRMPVRICARRDGVDQTVLRGHVTPRLIPEPLAPHHRPAPKHLAELEVADLAAATSLGGDIPVPDGQPVDELLAPAGSGAFRWTWRAPYFYCHFSHRVQHSGFVRCLEETVDRFLAARGISVGRLLAERSWIPVVSRARVRLGAPAEMEETVHTVLRVTDLFRSTMFDAVMDCFVHRERTLVRVATARILHGYAISRGPRAGELATLDAGVIDKLRGVAE